MKIVILNIIFNCWLVTSQAQSFPDIKFNHLTETEGLSSNSVTSICQDGDGIIWAGTHNGLDRFDGYGFANFYADPYDAASINASDVENLYNNRSNDLWTITSAGLCDFNTMTHKSVNFKATNPLIPCFHINDGSSLWFDSTSSNPYIVSPVGLYHFDSKYKLQKTASNFDTFTYKSFVFDSYKAIVADRNGDMWAFCHNRIFKINQISKKVEQEFRSPDPTLDISKIIFDSHKRCWATAGNNGLILVDIHRNEWKKFHTGLEGKASIENGVEWDFNGKKYLVFATSNGTLLFIDEEKLVPFTFHFRDMPGSINSVFVDRQNVLWIATDDGIYFAPSAEHLFQIIPVNGAERTLRDATPNSHVYNVKEYNGYWIARRYNGGILWYSKEWKLKLYLSNLFKGLGAQYDQRMASTEEGFDFMRYGNKMFITTEWGILSVSIPGLKRRLYNSAFSTPIMRLRTIIPIAADQWWIRSFNQGVFVFNPKKKKFVRHYDLAKSCAYCPEPEANFLTRDKKGRIFESTNEGLYEYHPANDSFMRVTPKGSLILGTSLMGMAVDSSGLLWIGTDNGLIAYDPDSEKVVKTFSENNRIGQVQRITIDKYQNVWFNSLGGYWCWLRKRDKVIQFKYSQGLPYNDDGIFYTTNEGEVLAGGQSAVVRFFPKGLMDYNSNAQTKIVDISVNDHQMLRSPPGKDLVINPDENNLSILFDVINYSQTGNNLYYYNLNPGREGWTRTENGKLTFNNLAPGKYLLSVRGGNRLQSGYSNTDTLSFIIKPHWYQSWWFYLCWVLLVAIAITATVTRRIAVVRKEANFKTRIAQTEMTALRAQMNPHFIFNSLNGIEYFILNNDKRHASLYLNKFARLIRIILSNSRRDLVPFEEDMQGISLYVDLELLRFNHCFRYTNEIDPQLQDCDLLVPPLLIQPFVENAIIHGFAASEKKDLQLKVKARLNHEYIVYTIEDNGVGRKQSTAYNALNKPSHKSLGMQITQERINIINQQQQSESALHIEDLYDQNGNAAGTRISLAVKCVYAWTIQSRHTVQ